MSNYIKAKIDNRQQNRKCMFYEMANHMISDCRKLAQRSTRRGTTNWGRYNIISINYIKAKIHNTLENSKCRLCGDRSVTVI